MYTLYVMSNHKRSGRSLQWNLSHWTRQEVSTKERRTVIVAILKYVQRYWTYSLSRLLKTMGLHNMVIVTEVDARACMYVTHHMYLIYFFQHLVLHRDTITQDENKFNEVCLFTVHHPSHGRPMIDNLLFSSVTLRPKCHYSQGNHHASHF